MRGFSVDIRGRIRNFKLPKTKPLIPLFEAIVNSIYAIEERKAIENFKGIINIEIVRDNQCVLNLPKNDKIETDVVGFNIIDNGVGFDDNNMNSFLQSDSVYRLDKGGKGVGRFSWLKAFERVEVESVYKDLECYVMRKFEFSLKNPEIDDTVIDSEEISEYKTTVKLINCKIDYSKNISKQAVTIANKIIQHCFIYLMSEECPQINLIDDGVKYCINDLFSEQVEREENKYCIEIDAEKFELKNLKVKDASLNGCKLYMFGNDRMVKEIDLGKYIVDLDKQMLGEDKFYYVGILTGEYLDTNVDVNRTTFNIPEKRGEIELSLEEIIDNVIIKIKEYLKEYLDPIEEEKNTRIKKYVTEEAPQYRHLLKYMSEDIKKIKPNLSDDKLDDELYQIKRKFNKTIKEDSKKLLDKVQNGFSSDNEYKKLFEEQIGKISEANQAELANYVAHRKIIIDLLERGIKSDENEKFKKESYIHNLIYPMKTTSNEIDYESHNLWLIDEKLSYCSYISSDISFNNDKNDDRTDIMILDRPVAVSDDKLDGSEFDTIVLFELKRPMRNDYTNINNPINQLYEYVDKIRDGKAKDKNGRNIKVGAGTKFYLYAVCDITSSLEKTIKFFSFKQTPDNMGYYLFNDTYNAYVEILSYDKIIIDAKKRNRVLFEKLGV